MNKFMYYLILVFKGRMLNMRIVFYLHSAILNSAVDSFLSRFLLLNSFYLTGYINPKYNIIRLQTPFNDLLVC